jgi:hypothetical protein
MFGSESSRRNAIAMTIGWWYIRRLIRKRGAAAVAGLVAGEGLSFTRNPRRRHPVRWLLLGSLLVGAGFFWWRRQQGGRGDWGDWDPMAPVTPVTPAAPAPVESVPGPVAT